jgi:hypothetical protein
MTLTLIAPKPVIYKISLRGEPGPPGPPGDGETAIADITGLQTALNGKAPSSHTHAIANVTDLQSALDGKASSAHTHAQSDVTNLVSDLAGKAPASHTHSYTAITGLGSIVTQNANSVTLSGGTMANVAISGLSSPSNSDEPATKGYVDSNIASLLKYKGGIDCSTNPNYPAATSGWAYNVTVAGRIGGASGPTVEVGELIIAKSTTSAGNHATVGANWNITQGNIEGALRAANNLAEVLDQSAARANIGAQAADATLTALAGIATSANKLIYATGSDAFATCDLSAFARTLIDDADADTARNTLGVTSLLAGKASNVGSNGCHIAAPTTGQVIYWTAKSQSAFTINGIYGIKTTAGTATVAIKINGTAVGGLSAISVTTTAQDVAATSGNTVAIGDEVCVEVTTASGATHLRFTLKDTQ